TAIYGVHYSGDRVAHAVRPGPKIDFALAVAVAGFQELARTIDAESVHDVARPAAAVAFACQAPLGREHATAARRFDVALEVGLAAEQAETVFDLPLEARRIAGGPLRTGRVAAAAGKEEESNEKNGEHGVCRDQPRGMISTRDAAEM